MLADKETVDLLKAALREDLGHADETSLLVIPKNHQTKADVIFKERGILAGLTIAEQIFRLIDPDLRFLPAAKNGDLIEPDRVIFYVEGLSRSILAGERTALNFVSHLSGVATLTHAYVRKVQGTKAHILHTRKTIPLLRRLELEAVLAGGGHPHRRGLYDGILIKDNHLHESRKLDLKSVVQRARKGKSKQFEIGVEVKMLEDLKKALPMGFDYILVDNGSVDDAALAVKMRNELAPGVLIEISGGVHLDNVSAFAQTGVDRISIGALTHSARAIDLSLNTMS